MGVTGLDRSDRSDRPVRPVAPRVTGKVYLEYPGKFPDNPD